MTKIQIREKGSVPLDDPIHYEVGSNGTFLAVRNQLVDAVVPCDDLGDDLEKINMKCKWNLPPLPAPLFGQILRFFHEVQHKHETEVAVMLHFDFVTKQWAVTVPKQKVTGAHVDYDMTQRLPGYRCVGTMHSHVRMNAGHSGVDTHDEEVFDGLHVTLGNVDDYPEFSMDAEINIRGTAFKFQKSERIAGGVKYIGKGIEGVEEPEKEYGSYGGGYYSKWSAWKGVEYTLLLPLKEIPEIPKEWWDNVTVERYSYFSSKKKEVDNDDDEDKGGSSGNGGYGDYYGGFFGPGENGGDWEV